MTLSGGPQNDDYEFEASVDVVEPKGTENNVSLRLGERRIVATVPGLQPIEAGATATIRSLESAIHLFEADTGRALHSRSLESIDDGRTARPSN